MKKTATTPTVRPHGNTKPHIPKIIGVRLADNPDVEELLSAAIRGGFAKNPQQALIRAARLHLSQTYGHLKRVQGAVTLIGLLIALAIGLTACSH